MQSIDKSFVASLYMSVKVNVTVFDWLLFQNKIPALKSILVFFEMQLHEPRSVS